MSAAAKATRSALIVSSRATGRFPEPPLKEGVPGTENEPMPTAATIAPLTCVSPGTSASSSRSRSRVASAGTAGGRSL